MTPPLQVLVGVGAAALAAALCAGGGWVARGIVAERDALQLQVEQASAARKVERQDGSRIVAASTSYQQQAAQIRAGLLQPSKEADYALRTPVRCADGASAVDVGGVPVPAVLVGRLRDAGADWPAGAASAP